LIKILWVQRIVKSSRSFEEKIQGSPLQKNGENLAGENATHN
jgi:hypothetical protein